MFWLSQWMLKKQDERFLQALIETKAQVDEVSDRRVRFVLLQMRLSRALGPYLYIFKLMWEIIRGRYWKSSSKDNGGANQAPGGGTGAGGQPVAQFSWSVGATNPAAVGAFAPASSSVASDFEDAGILAGEVTAYRCWRLDDDGFLYSVFQSGYRWEPGAIAEGDAYGGNGIHAFKSIILMAKYADDPEGYVTGTIEMWGDVFEHERGYRASKAAIKSIDDSSYYDAEELRKRYGLNDKNSLPKPEA